MNSFNYIIVEFSKLTMLIFLVSNFTLFLFVFWIQKLNWNNLTLNVIKYYYDTDALLLRRLWRLQVCWSSSWFLTSSLFERISVCRTIRAQFPICWDCSSWFSHTSCRLCSLSHLPSSSQSRCARLEGCVQLCMT